MSGRVGRLGGIRSETIIKRTALSLLAWVRSGIGAAHDEQHATHKWERAGPPDRPTDRQTDRRSDRPGCGIALG